MSLTKHVQSEDSVTPMQPQTPRIALPTIGRRLLGSLPPIVAMLVLTIALLLVVGANPGEVFETVLRGAFGTPRSVGETLLRAAPLLLIAVTLAPSVRAGIYNLGAPGQMALGAAAAAVIALKFPDLPAPLMLTLGGLAAAVAGVVAAVVPAAMKARWDINEIVTTIAMNFIALNVVLYLVSDPFQSKIASIPQSDAIPETGWLPIAFEGTRAHWGLLLAPLAVIALFLFDRTKVGYRQRLFAANPSLSRQAAVHPRRMLFTVMVIAGVGAGLAGWLQVAGVDHRLYATVSDPVGFAGLFVVLLGATRPIGMCVAAVLLGALLQGGQALQIGVELPPEVVQVFIGLVLVAYAIGSRGVHTHDE